MQPRVNLLEKGQNALKSLFGMGAYLKKSSIETRLLDLVHLRVSQLNRCAFCIDMHSKDARAHSESEERLHGLIAWRETSYYTDKERAALAWAEAINDGEVPQEIYAHASQHLNDEELIDLTLAVCTTATWNRLNAAFAHQKPGSYTVGQFS